MAADTLELAPPVDRVVRVAVAADQSLVAESVRAALLNRGFDPVAIRWPSVDTSPQANGSFRRRRPRWSVGPPPDVAVLLCDLARLDQVQGAQALIETLDVPWLVLAGVPSGPAWGAVYERGATVVASAATGLDMVCDLILELEGGHQAQAAGTRPELIRSWRAFARTRGELSARLDTLTGREEEVLNQLHQGLGVRTIAEYGGVSEATVRSQVKAILRKLEVNSQIAAVAAYQMHYSSAAQQ